MAQPPAPEPPQAQPDPRTEAAQRWATSLHEAAHLATAEALGLPALLGAVFPSGAGVAWYGHAAPSPFRVAVVACAGRQGERLAAKHPIPRLCEPLPGTAGDVAIASGLIQAQALDDEAKASPLVTDGDTIDGFCLTTTGRWAGLRRDLIHRRAERIVRDNERTIVNVAARLFQSHVLTEPRLKPLLRRTMLMLDELLSQVADRQTDRERNYYAIVSKLANGESVSPAALESALKQAEKTPADIRADVRLAERRNGWRATVAQAADEKLEIADLKQAIAEADTELVEAGNRHAAVTGPLVVRLAAIRERRDRADNAKRELERTATGPALAELNGVRARLEDARGRAAELARVAKPEEPGPCGWSRARRAEEMTRAAAARRQDDRQQAAELLVVVQGEIEQLKREESEAVQACREA